MGNGSCSVVNCDRKLYARGYCEAHYKRLKSGVPMDKPIMRMRVPFWDRVDRSGGIDSCWEWTGFRFRNGYGAYHRGPGRLAHRHVATLAFGELGEGAFVMHACDNPACCNPLHLSVGSHTDNMADMVGKGRSCRGTRHGAHKLTDAEVAEVYFAHGSQRVVAERYGVSQSLVSLIKKGAHRPEALLVALAGQRRNEENWQKALDRGAA